MTKASFACLVFSHVSVTIIISAPMELASVRVCWEALILAELVELRIYIHGAWSMIARFDERQMVT